MVYRLEKHTNKKHTVFQCAFSILQESIMPTDNEILGYDGPLVCITLSAWNRLGGRNNSSLYFCKQYYYIPF